MNSISKNLCVCVCARARACVCVSVCVCVNAYMHACLRMHRCVFVCGGGMCVCVFVCVFVSPPAHLHVVGTLRFVSST